MRATRSCRPAASNGSRPAARGSRNSGRESAGLAERQAPRRIEPAEAGGGGEQFAYGARDRAPSRRRPASCRRQRRTARRRPRRHSSSRSPRDCRRPRPRCPRNSCASAEASATSRHDLRGGGEAGGYQTVLERESEQPASANSSNSAIQNRACVTPWICPASIGRLHAGKQAAPSWDRHRKYSRQLRQKRRGESDSTQISHAARPAGLA